MLSHKTHRSGCRHLPGHVVMPSACAMLARLEASFAEERCKLPHVLFAEALHCSVQGTGEVAATAVDELDEVNLEQLAAFLHQSLRLVAEQQFRGEVR